MSTTMTKVPEPLIERDPIVDTPQAPRQGKSENMLFTGHDPETGLGFWAHLGRLAPDPTIWEGIMALFIEDDQILSHRSIGRAVLEPSSGQLRFETPEPLSRWRLHLDGVAQRVSSKDAAARGLEFCHGPDGRDVTDAYEPLEVDIDFVGASPVWNTGEDVVEQGWGDLHLHQQGRYTGTVKYAGKTIPVNFGGGRDHTRGARDYVSLGGEWWAMCTFPSGRTIDIIQSWTTDGTLWSKGVIWDGETMHAVSDIQRVALDTADGEPRNFDVEFNLPDGPVVISGEALHSFTYTLVRPTGVLEGNCPPDGDTVVDVECPARYVWDGEEGFGWIERCKSAKDFADARV